MRFVMARSLLTYLSVYEDEAHENQSTVIQWARTAGRIALDLVERHRLFRQRNMTTE
jgi:hypothetical protein